mmetsp:Transcript_18992/g.29244  ORF Transcript_18992/g.29244 Transcript_18992/m.29244 type:complete len:274 (-) Transcript_18992:432-1253(-)
MSETATSATGIRNDDSFQRPKSKKELRAERKAAKKKAESDATQTPKVLTPAEIKEQKYLLKKERRKEQLKEREKEMRREMQRERKNRKRTRQRRELHAVGGGLDPQVAAQRLEQRRRNKKRKKDERNNNNTANQADKDSTTTKEEQDRLVFDKMFNGAGEEDESGARTLEMGVKCTDVVVGKGDVVVRNGSLVTVAYKLTGGKFGAVIDSSKKFIFRVGKGEVIRGWDIGVLGMAVGGRRKLIVPPKAGYQGQDIGAGPGALLYFDITVISST